MNQQLFTCDLCPDRDVCQAPCEWMEAQLPAEPPPGHLEQTYGLFPPSTLARPLGPPSNGPVRRFEALLTPDQWRALRLVYVEGLSQHQTALRLGLTRSALRNRLECARRKIARKRRRRRRS